MRVLHFVLCLSTAVLTLARGAETQPWKVVPLPEQTVGTPRSICFADAKCGWIVGDRGMCLATTDGGATWDVRPSGTDATLRCIRFSDTKSGFACGDGDTHAPDAKGHVVMSRAIKCGSVLATTDGGKTWKASWVPCNFEVWCVEGTAAPKIQVGVGCEEHLDGDITRSNDAGANWNERRVYRALSDIRAISAKRWVAVGSPVSVGFTGEIKDPAYLAKQCRALYSDDAGATWKVSKGSDGTSVLRALLCQDGQPLLAVGDEGAILRSDDKGVNWQPVASPEAVNLRSVAASQDGATIVAVGDRGAVLLSNDAGKTWKATWSGQPSTLLCVARCGEAFFAVGPSGILRCNLAELAKGNLPALPAAAKPVVKVATAAQRARARKGDYCVYRVKIQAPALGMNAEFEVKSTITDVNGDEFTMKTEVIKGQPPMGSPKSSEDKINAAYLEDQSTLAIGKSEVTKDGAQTFTATRLENDILEVGKTKLECVVVRIKADMGTAGEADVKNWYCVKELPMDGLVKMEVTQAMALPNGAKANMTQSRELIEYGRGK